MFQGGLGERLGGDGGGWIARMEMKVGIVVVVGGHCGEEATEATADTYRYSTVEVEEEWRCIRGG